MKPLPQVNWPERSGEYRIIQLYLGGTPYLRFQNFSSERDHADILRRFLESHGICVDAVPRLRGERYTVSGMGKSYVHREQRRVAFYGKSIGYDLGIDPDHLEQIIKLEPEWKLEQIE